MPEEQPLNPEIQRIIAMTEGLDRERRRTGWLVVSVCVMCGILGFINIWRWWRGGC